MARLFDRDLQQYLTGTVVPVNSVPLTMVCWFNTSITSVLEALLFIGSTGSDNDYFSSALRVATTSDITGRTRGVSTVDAVSANEYVADTWHHSAFVSQAANSRLSYLDGIPGTENTGSQTPNAGNINTTAIAAWMRVSISFYFVGLIAEIGIWSSALNASQINDLYVNKQAPPLVDATNLQAYYPLIDNDNDYSGNGYNLTPINSPGWGLHPPGIIYPPTGGIVTSIGFANMDRNFINMRG